MSRVTVIHEGRSFRCSPEVAHAYLAKGGRIDVKDPRGVEAYEYYARNRPLPPKQKTKTKTKPKE